MQDCQTLRRLIGARIGAEIRLKCCFLFCDRNLQEILDRRVDRLEDQVTQLDPLLPSEQKQGALLEKCHDLIRASERLAGLGQNAGAMQELARLLKAMNSYYSNRIEGEHTRPVEIERALAKRFSPDSEKARLQRFALAHIETEQWLLQTPPDGAEVYSTAKLADIHRHLFSQLPAADRFVVMRNDQGEEIERIVAEPSSVVILLTPWSGVFRGKSTTYRDPGTPDSHFQCHLFCSKTVQS